MLTFPDQQVTVWAAMAIDRYADENIRAIVAFRKSDIAAGGDDVRVDGTVRQVSATVYLDFLPKEVIRSEAMGYWKVRTWYRTFRDDDVYVTEEL